MSAQPVQQHRKRTNFATDTHCARGHDLRTPGVIYYASDGKMSCGQCRRERENRQNAERRSSIYGNKPRTHCQRGHEMTGDNVRPQKTGYGRYCVACKRINGKKSRLSNRTNSERPIRNEAQQQAIQAELFRIHDEREQYGKQHHRYEELTKRIRWLEGQVE